MNDTSGRGLSRRGLLGATGITGAARLTGLTGLAGAAGLAGVTGCTAAGRGHSAPPDPTATQPYRPQAAETVMQILAHPDDDLYFMNPDTLHSLQSGVPVVSVYVTAGESTGVNAEPYARRVRGRHDLPGYSSARHQGLRQAYATMLGQPHFATWRREVISLLPGQAGGPHAEVDTLGNATLVFLQVSMHEMSDTASLPVMWSQRGVALEYVDAVGAPPGAAGRAVWTHERLVDALAGLFERYRPTLIRTLDPDPDTQVHDRLHAINSDQPGYSDHRDHTAAALFAWKAMNQWVSAAARGGMVPQFTTVSYRGYYNQRWPYNLPPATVALKGRFMFQYGGDERWPCGNPGGCGDYGQGRNQPLHNRKGWIRSTRLRYPGATRVVTGTPGTRTAYQVLGMRAVRTTETAPEVWGPPEDLGGGPLAPSLSLVRDRAGRTLLFGLRFAVLEGNGGGNLRDVVVWQGRGWTSLGTPDQEGDRGRRTGSPVAVATADGRVHVFARDAAKAVCTRVLADGVWSPWRSLGGEDVQEGLAVLTDRSGRIHVFAAGHDTIHHWAQVLPGGPVALRPSTRLPRPADPPVAELASDGTIHLTYRRPAAVQLYRARLRV